jgi:hypothetical protein
MKRLVVCCALLLAVAGTALAEAPANPQKPGKWNIKAQMEIPGMPFKMPPINMDICLTEEDLKDPQKSVPNDPKAKCTVSDYEIDGNTVRWTVDCPKDKTRGEGELTFSEDKYTGWMKMQVGEQEMTTKYTGTWKGTCTK